MHSDWHENHAYPLSPVRPFHHASAIQSERVKRSEKDVVVFKSLYAVTVAMLAPCMVWAAGSYNDVPSSDPQFKQCIAYANNRYEGGNEASPVPGQTKVAAYCECLWNETPDNFRGNLAKFAETDRGARVDRICSRYSKWED